MLADIATRPIRSPMTLLLRAGDEVNSISRGLLDAMGCKYSAHAGQEKERGLEALYSWQSEIAIGKKSEGGPLLFRACIYESSNRRPFSEDNHHGRLTESCLSWRSRRRHELWLQKHE